MSSSIIKSDNGVTSGVTGIVQTAGSDGTLLLQTTSAGGTATTALTINNSQQATFANTINVPNTFGFKNRIINGAFNISQYNGSNSVSSSGYQIDRWSAGSISGGTFTLQQVTDAPSGFAYSYKYSVVTTTTNNDYNDLVQSIEANNVFDLQWGTSTGQTVTISFWVKCSSTGQLSGILKYTGPTPYYYLPTYTIAAANTWQYVTLTIPAPPTAAGAFANAANTTYAAFSAFVINSSGGSNTTPNTWSTSNSGKATGNINLGSTASATIQITGVQLEVGTQATSFDYRPYGTELALCQRYYQVFTNTAGTNLYMGILQAYNSTSVYGTLYNFPVTFRAIPSVSQSGTFGAFKADSSNATLPTTIGGLNTIGQNIMTTGWSGGTGLVAGYASVYYGAPGASLIGSAEL